MFNSGTPHVRGTRPHAPGKVVPEAPAGRRWAPTTSVGRWAVGLTVIAAAVMLLSLLPGRAFDWGFGPGLNFMPLAIPAGFGGAACAIIALFRRGDRTILVWLALVPALLISLFWLAFIVAEIVSPHD